MQNAKQNRKAWARVKFRAMAMAVDRLHEVQRSVDAGVAPNWLRFNVAMGEMGLAQVDFANTQFEAHMLTLRKASSKS
jgi:hypothetical protein